MTDGGFYHTERIVGDDILKHRARLVINKNLSVTFERKPNAFRRFWYWLLLGWQWEDIGE